MGPCNDTDRNQTVSASGGGGGDSPSGAIYIPSGDSDDDQADPEKVASTAHTQHETPSRTSLTSRRSSRQVLAAVEVSFTTRVKREPVAHADDRALLTSARPLHNADRARSPPSVPAPVSQNEAAPSSQSDVTPASQVEAAPALQTSSSTAGLTVQTEAQPRPPRTKKISSYQSSAPVVVRVVLLTLRRYDGIDAP